LFICHAITLGGALLHNLHASLVVKAFTLYAIGINERNYINGYTLTIDWEAAIHYRVVGLRAYANILQT